MSRIRAVLAAVAVVSAIACSSGPLELANIQVGRSLNQDRSIASITTTFKPGETVYVSVQTKAAGKGTIGVRWKYGSRVVDEPTKPVDYDGPASTEFHLQNSGGFPEGDYSVDVLIDGKQVGTRAFKVFDRSS
jgi:archaellum component FlaG (FlaF/FlaG flagellin family)